MKYPYSFKRTEEPRKTTETDPDTGEENTVTEKWMVYSFKSYYCSN